ncbi:glycosyltransferase family 2 protein [Vacuolonema iberomarrocanum]|uniref:glycosyltransferase family 2 protein n=1 Tax=Vacuolonema iberomarrocanum TaxID=3454632 RepID=UPI0019E521A6|nr:glycosyltransferase [filamentous cyanobacterium LEGE 07170]
MNLPRISIITPSFNQGMFIADTIQSVLQQDYPNLEYIVIDGGSTDGSVEIIRKYELQIDYWVSEPDRGQSDAIRKGFARCTGNLWNWLNSDDVLEPEALWKLAIAYQTNPHATIYAGQLTLFGEDTKLFIHRPSFQSLKELVCVWEKWAVPQPALYLSRADCLKVSGIDPRWCYGMDYDFYLQLAQLSDFSVQNLDFGMARMRRHPHSKTVSQTHQFRAEILKIFDHFAQQHPEFLPQGWRRSRALFAYISALQALQFKLGRDPSLLECLRLTQEHLSIWKYRYFWGLLRRKLPTII